MLTGKPISQAVKWHNASRETSIAPDSEEDLEEGSEEGSDLAEEDAVAEEVVEHELGDREDTSRSGPPQLPEYANMAPAAAQVFIDTEGNFTQLEEM